MGLGANLWKKADGGSGGGRGHSNMEHWECTAEIKRATRKARRRQGKNMEVRWRTGRDID
jgi:hypothetical protein